MMGLMDVLRGMQYGPHGQPRSGTGSGTGTGTGSGTGMSPITMAILGLLAYKALKSMSHRGEQQPAPAGGPLPGGNGGGNIAERDMPRAMPSPGTSRDTEPRDADMGRGWDWGRGDSGGGMPSSGGTAGQMSGAERSGGPAGDTTIGGAEQMGQGRIGDLIRGALGSLLAGSAAGGVMSGGLNDLLRQFEKHGFADTVDSWVGPGENKTIAPGDLAKVLGADQIDSMMQQSGLSREELLDGLSRHLPEVVHRLTPEGEVPHDIPM
jgi:uncharacterized protein YidB (DUF937 family)